MNAKVILLVGLGVFSVGLAQAKPKTAAEWQACQAKAQRSVNVLVVGTAGIDSAVAEQCGPPIAKRSAGKQPAGQHPQAVLNMQYWQPKFKALLGQDFADFHSAMETGSHTQKQGDWVIGEGYESKSGGDVQGFFAIHLPSERIYAALNLGAGAKTYGFRVSEGAIKASGVTPPKALDDWLAEYGRAK